MFSRFFIDRPIFASVLSIVITLTGAVAVFNLPLAQYPQITPPSIIVSCTYPGASAKVVAESVAAPIEQQVNGVENMIYMSSASANDGSYSLTVTFKPGVNLNFAQVLVQNRVNLALPLLPDVVKQTGVTTRKRNPDILLIVSIYSPHDRYDQLYVSNYGTIQILDEIARVDGVGDVRIFGQQDYSMRIWVDPDRLAALNLTAGDVVNAVREQNMQVAAGQVAQPPNRTGAPFELTVHTLGRLTEPQQFADIILKTGEDGRKVRIRDVGRVELGARNNDVSSKIDGHFCASLAVWQLPYANALQTADNVRAKMEELKENFPEDINYEIAYDTTPFIRESIYGVVHTLAEAVILVALVVLVFLQNWRSTIIPLTAVPVAIIGTFAVMWAIGFSLNNLTLFGLVLAIGIVVDDAIVVVEAVEHHIEEGLRPKQAAIKAMQQVSGPVVAVALVLSAVFLPCAFIGGITGMFFRQFALTIAVSTVISAFNSLTLSPALAALLLRPRREGQFEALPRLSFALAGAALGYAAAVRWMDPVLTGWVGGMAPLRAAAPWVVAAAAAVPGWFLSRPLNYVLSWFFRFFNWSFRQTTSIYTRMVGLALRGSIVVLLVYAGLLLLTWWTSTRLPTGYIPVQDQSRLYAAIQLPDSASHERTQAVVDKVSDIAAHTKGIAHTLSVAGQSFTLGANGSNFGNIFITLDDFDKRHDPKLYSDAVAAALRKEINATIPDAIVTILGPPAVNGLGSAGGFKFLVEDRSGEGDLTKLQKATEGVIAAAKEGRFRITDATLAALRREAGPAGKDLPAAVKVPEDVLRKIAPLKDREFDSRKDFAAALGQILDADEMTRFRDRVARQANTPTAVAGLLTVFRADSPMLYVDLDRAQCQSMRVNPSEVFTTLQVYLGSFYVNDFNRFGRTWQVVVQAEGPFRDDVEKVKRLKVRNADGNMVPLGSVLTVEQTAGPLIISRYNMYPAAAIVGNTRPGVSSGDGIIEMERLARQTLPKGMGYEWTEINYIQVDAGKNVWNNLIFPLAVAFVFLVLAAQYESWALPLAVILVVPMCILGSLTGAALTHWDWLARQFGVAASHSDINIFTQIGFVVLVGLASKNAILIVEFAKHRREAGLSRRDATLAAVKLRLRPILMTSFAFILGVVPLMIAVGAGAEMRRALGLAVFSGMLGVTLFGIFLTPVFFYMTEYFAETPLFASETVRRAGRVMLLCLGVALLGVPWLAVWLSRQFVRRPVLQTGPPAPPTNGRARAAAHKMIVVEGNEESSNGGHSGAPAWRAPGESPSDSPTIIPREDDPNPDRVLSK